MILYSYVHRGWEEDRVGRYVLDDGPPATPEELKVIEKEIEERVGSRKIEITGWSKFSDSFASPDGEAKQ